MHILFLTDNFYPEVNAPASRTFEHCKEWVSLGTDVTVITCVPNFPAGKVYAGFKNKLWQSSYIEGVRVIRVWSYIAKNEGFTKRILDYLSFMVAGGVAGLFVPKFDLVIGTSPQFFTVCAAYFVGLLRCRAYVFELRDIWPESIIAVGAMRKSCILRILAKLELFLYRKARLVVPVTNSFREYLLSKGIAGNKIEVITNGVDLSNYQPRPKNIELLKQLDIEGKFVLGYIGTHGMAHGLDTILEAASVIKTIPRLKSCVFIFLGNGAAKDNLIEKAKTLKLDNVIFLDSIAKEMVANYWSILDVSIIHLKRLELFKQVIPSKLFECMGMGIPVLHGVSGESAQIVVSEEVGLTFSPEDVSSLVAAITKIYEDKELRTKLSLQAVAAASKYDRKYLAKKMLDRLQDVAN